ncbi:sugar transferase [Nitrospinota bacterium]
MQGYRGKYLKCCLDKILAGAGLILLAPLFFLIIVAIKLEGLFRPERCGPAFERAPRINQGKPFSILKFRTNWKMGEDGSPITAAGRHLRRWYLDELPQLWHILRGEMSFVGPRPVPPWQYENYMRSGNEAKRILIPGLAGPTQGTKRRTDGRSAKDYELEYLRAYDAASQLGVLRLDAHWALETIRTALRGEGE